MAGPDRLSRTKFDRCGTRCGAECPTGSVPSAHGRPHGCDRPAPTRTRHAAPGLRTRAHAPRHPSSDRHRDVDSGRTWGVPPRRGAADRPHALARVADGCGIRRDRGPHDRRSPARSPRVLLTPLPCARSDRWPTSRARDHRASVETARRIDANGGRRHPHHDDPAHAVRSVRVPALRAGRARDRPRARTATRCTERTGRRVRPARPQGAVGVGRDAGDPGGSGRLG